ncbi:MAG TPA: hypothetical protein VJM50_20360 [Pyrinomonadaceae bacterium]|nr:hypothetical protein [Pyrinomonadaceae bacterium]
MLLYAYRVRVALTEFPVTLPSQVGPTGRDGVTVRPAKSIVCGASSAASAADWTASVLEHGFR